MTTTQFLRLSSWLTLIVIIGVTISPISWRPHDVLPVNVDRALAFCLMAALFVLAYPQRWFLIIVACLAGAGVIEALQFLSPTRHPHFSDAAIKAAGAALGVLGGVTLNVLRRQLTKP